MSLDFSKLQIEELFKSKGEEIKLNFKKTVNEDLDDEQYL